MRIKIGDKLPNAELFYLDQNNEVKKIDVSDLCEGKVIIIGMPGAFTKTCSTLHLPGYIKNYEQATKKGIGKNYTQNKIDKIYEKMGYNFTKNYDQILNDE